MQFITCRVVFKKESNNLGNFSKEVLETTLIHINYTFLLSHIVDFQEKKDRSDGGTLSLDLRATDTYKEHLEKLWKSSKLSHKTIDHSEYLLTKPLHFLVC